ncbi:PREDICTED: proline-rich protein PRCC [Acromyrmex echinatior]|uniref:Proline-rich protein PRCC n=1 Tax=Acromyrmex echinatior TaxID=103372 RepID=F4X7L0_ACREC|nr:PREDICTED: proline-rich protein PRCC [Acromyrmex echinatior]EGI57539.1 Proline-rich protein PRCC [Acromyrmex echinatior]
MSLVAYDSSDESSENGESEAAESNTVNNTDNDATEAVTVQISSKLSLPAPKIVSHSINVEEENDDAEHNLQQFLDTLPKPRDSIFMGNVEEVEDDILLKKETESQISKPAKKQIVRISVPSLLEFKDLEEESEEKPVEIVQSSQKGCGLFSLLTAPKGKTANNKTLIPQAVKNAAVKTNVWQSNAMRKSSTNRNDFKVKNPTTDKSHNESSSDEEDASIDFFGLATSEDPDNSTGNNPTELDSTLPSDDLVHKSNTEVLLMKHVEDHKTPSSSSINPDISMNSQSSKTLTSNVINLPKEEILLKNKAEVGPKLPIPEQEYNVDLEGNVAFDEKAIEYLCGRRGIKRKEIDEADIIEINGEDIKPDEREWLVKALTEESVHRPVSMQSGGVNSQSKKKHQITYLAHQAKAMELELKNQWSQNRMARKQTKSKYGF